MMHRLVTLAVAGLGVVLMASAVGVGAAYASPPAQPAFWVGGEAIKSTHNIESEDYNSRLWVTALNTVVKCGNDEGKGEIKEKGRGKWEAIYKECGAFEAIEGTEKKFEEGSEISGCTVEGKGAKAGEIDLKELKSRLVWGKGEELIFSLYEPEKAALAEVVVEGSSCSLKGTYELKGSVLAAAPRINEEELGSAQSVEDEDAESAVKQRYTRWEVEEEGKKTEGTAGLKWGADGAALEDAERFELTRTEEGKGIREPFAIHE
jgi:hypothetical protein